MFIGIFGFVGFLLGFFIGRGWESILMRVLRCFGFLRFFFYFDGKEWRLVVIVVIRGVVVGGLKS